MLEAKVNGIKINGITAAVENGKSGRYPLFRKLYMYIDEKRCSNVAREFINFILNEKGAGSCKEHWIYSPVIIFFTRFISFFSTTIPTTPVQ